MSLGEEGAMEEESLEPGDMGVDTVTGVEGRSWGDEGWEGGGG